MLDRRTENDRREANARAYALEATLKPLRDTDWRTVMAVATGKLDPKHMIGLAFRDLADNAAKIGTLNISPDLLHELIRDDR